MRDDTTTPFPFPFPFLFFLFSFVFFFGIRVLVLYDTGVRVASLVQGGWVLGKLNLDQRMRKAKHIHIHLVVFSILLIALLCNNGLVGWVEYR